MAKNIQLLLIENVDHLGIVGDVVNVRTGFARNFLLPRNLATKPSDDLIKQLAGKRAEAEKQVAQQRKEREGTNDKLKGVEIELVRACNDMGILYGAVTQQDVSQALQAKGFRVLPRDVRISQTIKRIDHFDIHIKLDKDLDAVVKLHVKPDRELHKDVPTEGAAPAGAAPEKAGAAEGSGKRRDALSVALEEANKPTEKTGWSARADKGGEKGGEKGAKGDASDAKGAKKSDKSDKVAEKGEKGGAKAEKGDKAKKK